MASTERGKPETSRRPPKDERRETAERLAEKMNDAEREKARRARQEDPALPSPRRSGSRP